MVVAVEETDSPVLAERLEAIAWSLLCRALVGMGRLERAVRFLDLTPGPSAPEAVVRLPAERYFAAAGACLARTLARSQYLRRRGVPSDVAIGVRLLPEGPVAHAWLEPYDGAGEHQLLTRVER